MKKQYLILIAAGIILAVLLKNSKKKIPEPVEIIKPGDKGNEVLGLQTALSDIAGLKLPNKGVYDNETLSAVQYYLKDSYYLYDYERGYVDKKFASDLFLMQNNSKTILT